MTVAQPPENPPDTWDKLIAGGISSIPGIGGVAGAGYQLVMEGPYNRRLHAWRLQITAVVNELVERYADILDNEVFLDAFVNATRAAQATHQQEKLDALRNAVMNSIAAGAPDVDEQARFFRLVDQFSAAHLGLLTFLDLRGPRWAWVPISRQADTLGKVIEHAFPEFRRRSEWYELLATDLADAHLIARPVPSLRDIPRANAPLTTELGKRFLCFILDGSAGDEGQGQTAGAHA